MRTVPTHHVVNPLLGSPVVTIVSGLNLSREMGTHFSQETLLKASLRLSEKLLLPTIFHIPDSKSLERLVELLENDEEIDALESGLPLVIHDIVTCTGADSSLLPALLAIPTLYFSVSGAGITEAEDSSRIKAKEFVAQLPRDRMVR